MNIIRVIVSYFNGRDGGHSAEETFKPVSGEIQAKEKIAVLLGRKPIIVYLLMSKNV
jgi:hypothetical protein